VRHGEHVIGVDRVERALMRHFGDQAAPLVAVVDGPALVFARDGAGRSLLVDVAGRVVFEGEPTCLPLPGCGE